MTRRRIAIAVGALLAAAGALLTPVGGDAAVVNHPRAPRLDLSSFSADPPSDRPNLLFIHHSCGGQWLAEPTPTEQGERAPCILAGHPNGGHLRARLAEHYVVHEASYGSEIGENTDLFDWLPKFRDKMDKILHVEENDRFLPSSGPDARSNQIVMFKSCFPNSDFVGPGTEPGNPAGPELTVTNAQATMRAVLAELAKRPDVLFVYVTAPPLAAPPRVPLWRHVARTAKHALTKGSRIDPEAAGALARTFNDWMVSPDGWLKGYPHANVVAFDYFDILTDEGRTNLAAYPTPGGDSHPASAGNQKATEAFVPFLNRAVARWRAAPR